MKDLVGQDMKWSWPLLVAGVAAVLLAILEVVVALLLAALLVVELRADIDVRGG